MLFCSINGFANPLSFIEINDAEIEQMEEFVQKSLSTRFNDQTFNDKMQFFGAFHAQNPSEFVFHIGDKLLIKKLVLHVKDTVKKDGNYRQYHCIDTKKDKRKLKDTVQSSIGTFFGSGAGYPGSADANAKKETIHSTKKVESLANLLYDKAMEIFRHKHKEMAAGFTKEMVDVRDEGSIKGLVTCIFCKKSKMMHFDSTYWVTSNLKKHINICYGNLGDIKPASIDDENMKPNDHSQTSTQSANGIDSTDNEPLENFDTDLYDEDVEAIYEDDSDVEVIESLDKNSESDEATNKSNTTLEISPLDANENKIYFQICQQTRIMRQKSLEHEEEEGKMPISIQNKVGQTMVALIEPDGNCLVSALAHQLFHAKLNTRIHENATIKLREDAIKTIKNDLGTYGKQIIWRDDFNSVAVGDDMGTKLTYFLGKLAEPNFWCGTETVIAISRLYSVNIIIFNESGTCYTVEPFNFKYNRCAIIAYCAYQTNPRKKKQEVLF